MSQLALGLGLGLAVAALSAAAAASRPFTAGSEATTAIALAAVAGGLALRSRRGIAPAPVRLRSASGWMVILLLGAGLELWQFASSPRSSHPTLSSLIDALTRYSAGRGVLFACWLLAGAWLVARGRMR